MARETTRKDPLDLFHPIVADWFRARFGAPTDAQTLAWPEIAAARDTLISAPTGSGKTLAAFLSCVDALLRRGFAGDPLPAGTEVLYVSPLKALSNDVHKNLEEPLAEIDALARSRGLDPPSVRVAVRSGDTPASERRRMAKEPPHILVTTPESLFILLTSDSGRRGLSSVRTVIVDEIHAVMSDKRGAHLSLSLERLERLVAQAGLPRPVRIGLSATQSPIEEVGRFLVGTRRVGPDGKPDCRIVDAGRQRTLDLAVEVPKDELGAVASNGMWAELYDRIAALVMEHRTTIVFVNTRRLVERVGREIAARVGESALAVHHGSLSRKTRLDAEQRLKRGEVRVIVATASLELGIDVGAVDLVCQIGSPRAIRTLLQRVGRSGHRILAVPRGRLLALTRDQCLECAALVRAARAGKLDRLGIRRRPLDVLAQQIVAISACEELSEDELFELCRGAWSYSMLERREFDEVIAMLSDGIETRRGRSTGFLHRDLVNGRVTGRRGARIAAVTSGGAIPDVADYDVISEPEGTFVGKLDEDFSVESMAGDIFLLGNTSWRIIGVEAGRVRVSDAGGAPPTIPFWRAEGPSRTAELSEAVSELRAEVEAILFPSAIFPPPAGRGEGEGGRGSEGVVRVTKSTAASAQTHGGGSRGGNARSIIPPPHPLPEGGGTTMDILSPGSATSRAAAISWLERECSLSRPGAEQAVAYLTATRAALGAVPTQRRIVAERFFDEAGGMQLVIHAPFGGRVNRAWGLALRKRFCRTFDFELQAAATDDGIVLSLGPQHSFPLESVFRFLGEDTVGPLLEQALLVAPMFGTRWRWNATRALAILRFRGGKKVPPPLQRFRAEDLLAAIFPGAIACGENHEGPDIEIPHHPLVDETMRDCLEEAMDLAGLQSVLSRIASGEIECLSRDTPEPSPMSHEILNSNPYTYLDDAPLEERRTRAVSVRRGLPDEVAGTLGALDPDAIALVSAEAWPDPRDPNELHDALLTLGLLPEPDAEQWRAHVGALLETRRASWIAHRGGRALVAAERLPLARALLPDGELQPKIAAPQGSPAFDEPEDAATALVRGWLSCIGPVTSRELALRLGLAPAVIDSGLARVEGEGQILRGRFLPFAGGHPPQCPPGRSSEGASELEWCDRVLLARIHRLTIGRLRREIEPVSTADFVRFLLRWQHAAPGTQLHGEEGLLRVLGQLQGFEAAASSWEAEILPLRVAGYRREMLDALCLSGEVAWGRLSLRHAGGAAGGVPPRGDTAAPAPARATLRAAAPIGIALREDLPWLVEPAPQTELAPAADALTHAARDVLSHLQARGASFLPEIVTGARRLKTEVEAALRELVAAGHVTADGFQALRGLLRRPAKSPRRHLEGPRPRNAQGRWSLLPRGVESPDARERFARALLERYGVVFRDVIARETRAPAWRELLLIFRRLEARGEIRGGRFIAGAAGEHFALPAAVEALRTVRRDGPRGEVARVGAGDPLNLVGIILPGARMAAGAGRVVAYRDGVPEPEAQSAVIAAGA